jgi:hypothetical protein
MARAATKSAAAQQRRGESAAQSRLNGEKKLDDYVLAQTPHIVQAVRRPAAAH